MRFLKTPILMFALAFLGLMACGQQSRDQPETSQTAAASVHCPVQCCAHLGACVDCERGGPCQVGCRWGCHDMPPTATLHIDSVGLTQTEWDNGGTCGSCHATAGTKAVHIDNGYLNPEDWAVRISYMSE